MAWGTARGAWLCCRAGQGRETGRSGDRGPAGVARKLSGGSEILQGRRDRGKGTPRRTPGGDHQEQLLPSVRCVHTVSPEWSVNLRHFQPWSRHGTTPDRRVGPGCCVRLRAFPANRGSQRHRTRAPARACPGSRPGRRPPAARQSRDPGRRASPGSAAGPVRPACRAGTERCPQGIGQAGAFQISRAYSRIVRSDENRPLPATFTIALRTHAPGSSRYKAAMRSCDCT